MLPYACIDLQVLFQFTGPCGPLGLGPMDEQVGRAGRAAGRAGGFQTLNLQPWQSLHSEHGKTVPYFERSFFVVVCYWQLIVIELGVPERSHLSILSCLVCLMRIKLELICQYSDRSICNIGTQITQIWIYILDVISRIHIHIWRPPGRLNGGVWGVGCPPRNQNPIFTWTHVSIEGKLSGALAGKKHVLYGLGPNPVAGENCLHFSILDHFSKFSEL
jgi:hypothetical protein